MITLTGRIPSKKNSKMAIPLAGRCILIPQANYRKWHKEASKQLIGVQAIPTPCTLTIDFWLPDLRRTDLSNKTESIMDLLVDNDILPDDSYIYVPHLILNYKGLDRLNPRAEIQWQIENKNQS